MTYKVYTLFKSGLNSVEKPVQKLRCSHLINTKNPEINYFYAFILILAVGITATKGIFLINVKDVK